MKKFTKEGRFECGLDEIVKGKLWAFTPGSATEHPVILGVAIANERGWMPIPGPWCHADTYDEMQAHCDELNQAEGISKETAARIIMSSMKMQEPDNKYLKGIEQKIVERIVRDALLQGWSIDVYDGGETTLKRSKDRKSIIEAMASTDSDMLTFYDDDSKRGWVQLIYGNGDDLISNWSSPNKEFNDLCESWLNWIENQDA